MAKIDNTLVSTATRLRSKGKRIKRKGKLLNTYKGPSGNKYHSYSKRRNNGKKKRKK